MTIGKKFKQAVRERMARTGESYSLARVNLSREREGLIQEQVVAKGTSAIDTDAYYCKRCLEGPSPALSRYDNGACPVHGRQHGDYMLHGGVLFAVVKLGGETAFRAVYDEGARQAKALLRAREENARLRAFLELNVCCRGGAWDRMRKAVLADLSEEGAAS